MVDVFAISRRRNGRTESIPTRDVHAWRFNRLMSDRPKPSASNDSDHNRQLVELAEQVRQLREEVAAMRQEIDHLANRQKWFY